MRKLILIATILLLVLTAVLIVACEQEEEPSFTAVSVPSWVSTEAQNRLNNWFGKDERNALYTLAGDLTDAGGFWSTAGNAGTTAGTNYVGTSDEEDLVFKTDETEVFRLADGAAATWTGDGGTDLFNLLVGNLKVGNGTPGVTLGGEDAYIEGTLEVDGAVRFDSTSDLQGNVSDSGGVLTVADNMIVDGQADAVQLTVQGYTTQTNSLLVVENSGGTDQFTVGNGGDVGIEGTLTFENDETISNATDGELAITTPVIWIGDDHTVTAGSTGSGILSGNSSELYSKWSVIGGGLDNIIMATNIADDTRYSVIAGGSTNTISTTGDLGTIGGGGSNIITGTSSYDVIGGGYTNSITSGGSSVVAGGGANDVTAAHAVVGGGYDNDVSGSYGAIPGGMSNGVTADYSLAAGRRAQADHPGSFVWADSTDADYTSATTDTFNVRADYVILDADVVPQAGFQIYPENATNTSAQFDCYGSVAYTSQLSQTICVLPANANIVDITWVVTTVFNDSGTDVINCGISPQADPDDYVDNYDASSAGVNRMGDAADMPYAKFGDVGASDVTVVCLYDGQNDNASAGAATLIISYVVD